MTLFGLDLSNWQKTLDLSKAKAQGYSFFIVKSSEGAGFTDPSYEHFRAAAKALKVRFAAYHFVRAEYSAKAQAARIATATQGDHTVPVALDCERHSTSRPTLTLCSNIADELAKLGIASKLLYFPQFWWIELNRPAIPSRWVLWQALYGSNSYGYGSATYPGDGSSHWNSQGGATPAILQFGSSCKLDGFTTGANQLDVDAFRGSLAQLDALRVFKNYGYVPPVVTKYNLTRTLSTGMHGDDVKHVQRLTGALDDGVFGSITKNHVIRWQLNHHLSGDGVFGPLSAHAAGWLYNGK